MKSIRKSLSAQLLAGFLVFSIVPVFIIGFMSFASGRQSIITNVQIHLKNVAVLKKNAIDEWTEHLKHALTWIAAEPEVIHAAQAITLKDPSNKTHADAYRFLAAEFGRMVSLGHVSQVSLLDKDTGRILVSSDPSWEGRFREKNLFFIYGKKSIYLSDIFLSLSMGRPTMVISIPVMDKSGDLLGVLAAHADFARLSAIMMERTGLSKTTETFLVNKSNLLITNTVFAPNDAFEKWIFGEGAKRAIAGQSGVDLFLDYRDVKVIGAYLWLKDRKLALIAKQDASEAFAAVTALRQKITFIGISISLVALFSSFLFAQQVTTPLLRLVKGAHAIGKGDLDYRVGSSTQNEIGILSTAFDEMAENLKSTTISLAEKEVLLREIHHRVKNNLQMIQSLMNLQLNQIIDEKSAVPLRDSINRISSIAMVHETLYKSKDLSTIDLKSYFQELTSYLVKSLGPSTLQIELQCSIEQLPMHLDSVVACGLIMNELITNALKHAFVDMPSGKIIIDLHGLDKTFAMLIVSDNGVGMSGQDRSQEKGSIGLDLVNILVKKQLEGEISIDRKSGLTYQIRFPIKTV
ncbi:MAG: HAMP domain-containing protein [Proteobacteria bacterium]|nr:HAMP domain-containing protein [Pseudomonadota bacterium]MBU1582748.1 HAMP domain-containing protein [Pseudomonadota bacterium]MBU2455295.1 HAMP domain-containing protein [Pseudomonadota bacterium]MBU2627087.1 HAMP domain-containing protein [Pseudomonadota bacterium]